MSQWNSLKMIKSDLFVYVKWQNVKMKMGQTT